MRRLPMFSGVRLNYATMVYEWYWGGVLRAWMTVDAWHRMPTDRRW